MEEMIIVEFFQSDSWKISNPEFGILLGVEGKCDSVVTKKELDMLRFYGGDIRKRTEEGKLLIINSSENSKDPKDLLWSSFSQIVGKPVIQSLAYYQAQKGNVIVW